MCDTLCGPGPNGMVFAKNSDRPIGEMQLATPYGRRSTQGCTLRTQYLRIGDTGSHATFLSSPTWLWGAEHGVNEFGVAIGNERVSTTHDVASAKPSLIGMDLVRLGLERARTAEEALHVITDLLTVHGQGGIADTTHNEAYDSSFLIADPTDAFILDTAGRDFAASRVPQGTAISNRHSVRTEWVLGSDALTPNEDFERFRDQSERTAHADVRLKASRTFLDNHRSGGLTPAQTAAHLRDHGHGPWGEPGAGGPCDPPPGEVHPDFRGVTVCMHVRGLSVTAASFVAELSPDVAAGAPITTYVALGSPCVSIYVPAFPMTVAGPPPFIPFELSGEPMWKAADALRQRVEDDPAAIDGIRAVLTPVEDALWREAADVVDRPHLWSEVGSSWGPRALHALVSCL